MGSGMTDFQRMSLDFAGLFLFVAGFILAIHFRSYALVACFWFFGAAGFFSSLVAVMLLQRGSEVSAQWAVFACGFSAVVAAGCFVSLFVQAVA